MTPGERLSTIKTVLDIRAALLDVETGLPERRADRNLLVGSWNMRHFGQVGNRTAQTFFIIAEIMSRFDIVAVQEINSDSGALSKLMSLLGADWAFFINDMASGPGGNNQRMGYIYNTRRCAPNGFIAELVINADIAGDGVSELTDSGKKQVHRQLQRPPLAVGFRAGWKNFTMLSVHLQPGASESDKAVRAAEVQMLLRQIAKTSVSKREWTEQLIIVGDFNFYENHDVETIALFADEALLEDAPFVEPDGLKGKPTNLGGTKMYDRIFVRKHKYLTIETDDVGKTKGGVFRFNDVIDDETQAKEISDHLPVWTEINIDAAVDFLEERVERLNEELSRT
ncbi:MAG: endonuclease/exonuclease/phosphatase family protein, partial [Pseudomonadota bacterium]